MTKIETALDAHVAEFHRAGVGTVKAEEKPVGFWEGVGLGIGALVMLFLGVFLIVAASYGAGILYGVAEDGYQWANRDNYEYNSAPSCVYDRPFGLHCH